ncbi:hypothetical protein RYZ26_08155 [Terasakiella sp. A23]|uniref:hypothetical protein n=1 Tax=Terasakiella sp. FCG-A23 TaxID=3080561 RepID=UPI002953449B|nr:hypothetical protein [Terasakiella sp. A23]MDV7339561.1 hypothetical protein [Terasakiella sp. A23]
MMGAGIPFGAEQRLLPEWLPLSFFGFALLCLPLGWLIGFIQADVLADFSGGFGPVLAMIHMFTIGVLMTTVLGASLQMLPVATATVMSNPQLVISILVLHILGTYVLLGGFAHYFADIATMGSALIVTSSLIYVYVLVKILFNTQDMDHIRRYGSMGAFALLIVVTLGFSMILQWADVFDLPPLNPACLHAGWAVFGFMGFLVFAFSRIMIPMLCVSDKTNDKLATSAFITAIAALTFWSLEAAPLALIMATLTTCLHVYEMCGILKGRLMKRLGPEWQLIRFGWVMMPVSLILLLGASLFESDFPLLQIGVLAAILGWLLSFILGVLQRIIPFLLSMQIARKTGMPELPSKLAHEKMLKFISPLHITAVLVMAGGIALNHVWIIRGATLLGIASGLLFISFFISALKRKRLSLEKMTP